MRNTILATTILCISAATAVADTSFVDENFDSYTGGTNAANQAAFEAVWRPDNGDGVDDIFSNPAHVNLLAPDYDSSVVSGPEADAITAFFDQYPEGVPDQQGISSLGRTIGGVSEFNGSSFEVVPDENSSAYYGGDIFVDASTGNWRASIGLRNDTIDRDPAFGFQAGLNIIEMGLYNADTCDPTVAGCDTGSSVVQDPEGPGYVAANEFVYRTVLFANSQLGNMIVNGVDRGPMLVPPNYQYFELDPALDLVENGGNGDGDTDSEDFGPGWHTYSATVTPDGITYELDLFRNGINEITGLPGPDASSVIEIGLNVDPANPENVAGFTSLRLGGMSGITANSVALYDNVFLSSVDVVVDPGGVPGDYNDNGIVDAADYSVWLANLGGSSLVNEVAGTSPGIVDNADYEAWKTLFGNSVSVGTGGAVPEPGAIFLLVSAMSSMSLVRSRRSK